MSSSGSRLSKKRLPKLMPVTVGDLISLACRRAILLGSAPRRWRTSRYSAMRGGLTTSWRRRSTSHKSYIRAFGESLAGLVACPITTLVSKTTGIRSLRGGTSLPLFGAILAHDSDGVLFLITALLHVAPYLIIECDICRDL